MTSSVRLLYVDSETATARTADALETLDGRFTVETATSIEAGCDRIGIGTFDCVVSEYELPDGDGIELLERVREVAPELPFILFTGSGSEAVASEAIARGVTDYVRRGDDQYDRLADRIDTAIDRTRDTEPPQVKQRRLSTLLDQSPLGVIEWNKNGEFVRLNDRAEEILGYPEDELRGTSWERIVPESDQEELRNDFATELVAVEGWTHSINENITKDGDRIVCEWYNRAVTDDGELLYLFSQFHDISERREYQRELERYEAYLQGSTDIITVVDDSGTIQYESSSVIRVLGYEPEELLDQNAFEYIHPDDTEEVESAFVNLINGSVETETVQCRFRTTDGSWRWLEIHGQNRLDHPEIEGIVTNSRDIHARKEQSRRLETLTSNLPGIVYRCHNSEGWPMELVRGECESITGYSASAFEANEVVWGEEIIHPEDAACVWEQVQSQLATDQRFEVTYRITTRDGEVKWMWERGWQVEGEGGETLLEGFITDITDRKEDQEQLEATNVLLSTLFETLPVGVLAEDAHRNVLAINERMLELFEVSGTPGDLAEQDCEQFAGSVAHLFADPDEFIESLDELIDNAAPVHGEELSLTDGRTYERNYEPIELPNGNGHLWVYRDITDRKQREQVLEQKNEQLDEFASVVSHDLRNPIQVLHGALDGIEQDGAQSHLDRGHRALDRMETLVDDLLTLARQEQPIQDTERVSLASITTECWKVVKTEDADLVVGDDRTFRANPERLQQLFENLIRNAVEHGGEDVTVTVGASDRGFYVADDGPGIDPDERDDIFDAGYTASQSGTGFGLSIVEQVVDAHDWTIHVSDSADGGARFEIEFGDR